PPCAGDCPGALSVSASTVRLGQDRLRGVLASGTMRESERHPILHITACQAKICHFHIWFQLMERRGREGMNKFLGDKVELRGVSKNLRILLVNPKVPKIVSGICHRCRPKNLVNP